MQTIGGISLPALTIAYLNGPPDYNSQLLRARSLSFHHSQNLAAHCTTTEIYLHSIGEAEREAMAVFEKAPQHAQQEEILTQNLTS